MSDGLIVGMSPELAKLVKTVEHDVRHEYENYCLEARHACKKLSEELAGRIVKFKSLGRPEMRGRVILVSEMHGSVRLWVVVIPKRGGDGAGKEIYLSDIVALEKELAV